MIRDPRIERLAQEICRSLGATAVAPQPARSALEALNHEPEVFDAAVELAVANHWLAADGPQYQITEDGARVARRSRDR